MWKAQRRYRETRLVRRARRAVNPEAVIVLGQQKSGTSAIAHLLARATGASKTIDIPALWHPTIRELVKGDGHLARVIARDPKPFRSDIIKEPNLTFIFDQVLEVFPDSRYVFVVRDPCEVVRSILDRIGLPGDLPDISGQEMEARWRPLFDVDLTGGQAHHYVDIIAYWWTVAADVYARHQHRMELVRYEDFIQDKEGVVRRLARALGLEPDHPLGASVDKQYQPRGKHRGDPSAFFGPNLERILDRCGRYLEPLGYRANE